MMMADRYGTRPMRAPSIEPLVMGVFSSRTRGTEGFEQPSTRALGGGAGALAGLRRPEPAGQAGIAERSGGAGQVPAHHVAAGGDGFEAERVPHGRCRHHTGFGDVV